MKRIIARDGEGREVPLEVPDEFTNSQAAAEAARALNIQGVISWDPIPRAVPDQTVRPDQVFVIRKADLRIIGSIFRGF